MPLSKVNFSSPCTVASYSVRKLTNRNEQSGSIAVLTMLLPCCFHTAHTSGVSVNRCILGTAWFTRSCLYATPVKLLTFKGALLDDDSKALSTYGIDQDANLVLTWLLCWTESAVGRPLVRLTSGRSRAAPLPTPVTRSTKAVRSRRVHDRARSRHQSQRLMTTKSGRTRTPRASVRLHSSAKVWHISHMRWTRHCYWRARAMRSRTAWKRAAPRRSRTLMGTLWMRRRPLTWKRRVSHMQLRRSTMRRATAPTRSTQV